MKIKKVLLSVAGLLSLALPLVWFASRHIPIEAADNNLISNPSVETAGATVNVPKDWYQDFWGSNQRKFTYPVAGQEGNSAVKVEITRRGTGDAKWAFNDVPVSGRQSYEFYDYYRSNTNSQLVIRYKLRSGSYRYVDLAYLQPTSEWKQTKHTFSAPSNAVSATVYHLINKVGWLITDNYSLSATGAALTPTVTLTPTTAPTLVPTTEPTVIPTTIPTTVPTIVPTLIPTAEPTIAPTAVPTTVVPTTEPTIIPTAVPTTPPNTSELVTNGDFETADDGGSSPVNWFRGNWGTNTVTFSYPVEGNNSAKAAGVEVTQFTDGDAKWYFGDIPVTSGKTYQFSDYYKSNVTTRIVVQFAISGSPNYTYVEVEPVPAAADWQKVTRQIVPPSGATAFTVFHLIDKVGNLTIDDASVREYTDPNVLSQGLISLDFDDGWGSTYQNGLPILEAAGFKSTQYIISGSLGQPEYMTVAQMLDAQARGHEIGAHSKTHPQLPLLSQSQQMDEIGGSRQDLMAMGAGPVNAFAYPYGEYNTQVVQNTVDAGFLAARTALYEDSGYNTQTTNRHLLKTFSVEGTTPLTDIYGWIDQAIATKTWVILVFHQVDNSGGQYSISPQNLQSVVDYIKSKNARVVTVSEGLQAINQ